MGRTRTKALPWALVLALSLLTGCLGTGAARPRPADVTEALDQIIEGWHERAWVPGVAVSVRQGTTLTWSTAAGYADEDAETPLQPDMAFYIASVTKPFVAATVLSLVDDGLVGLDDALRDYVPGFPTNGRATIRQLLGMRSGIPDYTQAFGFTDGLEEDLYQRRSRRWSTQALLDIVADAGAEFAPGQRFAYSNTNYILLSEVIRVVTGQPWWRAVEERVLEPLELDRTMLPNGEEPPALASGHTDLDRDAMRESLAGRPYESVGTAAGAAGGLVSTTQDLTAFARGVFGGTLLSAGTLDAMTHVERVGFEREYGLGIFVQQPDLRTRVVGHTGGGIGYSSSLWYAPEHDLAIAVLVNDSVAEPQDLAELLLRRLLRQDPRAGDLGPARDP